MWSIIEHDSVFSRSQESLTLAQEREVTARRVKRLMEYDVFSFNEAATNPLMIQWFSDAVGMYDWSLSAKMNLNVNVRESSFFFTGMQ